MLPDGNRPGTGYAKFDTSSGRVVTMRVATSLISARPGQAQPRARGRPARHVRRRQGARAARLGRASSASSRSRARPTTSCTTLYSNLYRLNLYPNSAFENTGTNAAPGLPARRAVHRRRPAAQHADADRRPRQAGQGLRQQRLLGHLPDRLAGLLAAVPEGRGRDGRRLRAAVPRRRLGRALVLAGLRQPDDRHELGRRLRRRLRQGRPGLRRHRRLRRGAEERHRRAAGPTRSTPTSAARA